MGVGVAAEDFIGVIVVNFVQPPRGVHCRGGEVTIAHRNSNLRGVFNREAEDIPVRQECFLNGYATIFIGNDLTKIPVENLMNDCRSLPRIEILDINPFDFILCHLTNIGIIEVHDFSSFG